ncbi:PIN domain-containing protein [Candidatus Poribacteria bacterium]|nr:PIN domain-containing protein [Candidatus Poribacteria bacterium]
MICFDTHVLIWGVRGWAGESQQDEIGHTRRFIERLRVEGTRILIPAPVVAEYLLGFESSQLRISQFQILQREFEIRPLDAASALVAAELEGNRQVLGRLGEQAGFDRQRVRMDAFILGIAITSGAERIISADAKMAVLADGRIPVEPVPRFDLQQDLLELTDEPG